MRLVAKMLLPGTGWVAFTELMCDDYLHHWWLASSRLESLLMTAATTKEKDDIHLRKHKTYIKVNMIENTQSQVIKSDSRRDEASRQ